MKPYFKIEYLGQNVDNNVVILSGTSFGFIGKPLVFRVSIQETDSPLLISFQVIVDKSKTLPEFKIGKIKDNKLDLIFFIPNQSGNFGLSAPISLLVIEENILGFIFSIDVPEQSKTYRIQYEFYHGKLTSSTGDQQ